MFLENVGQDISGTAKVLHFFFISSPQLTLPLLFIETSNTQREREREREILYSQLRRYEKIEQCGGAHVNKALGVSSFHVVPCVTRCDVSILRESQTLGLLPSIELEAEQLQALLHKYYHKTL